ncbi:RAMP superfamily CRISPR-associated protein [uncultured Megasphaera sp.]|uniref:RAMP superfamily CRISPR-associated protein n=1 Tax=uncultured Megasphaera sp. TaxID=165188 RepID=UPI00265AC5BF|nr:RAMP superfamily CRISPR-associated protein [uncultured Megasphaera sp.]
MMNSPVITKRIRIHGTFTLASPLRISSGQEERDGSRGVDIFVLKDEMERPFIPGTSIAGALRSRVHWEHPEWEPLLFGYAEGDRALQSAVTVTDSTLDQAEIVVRDGVHIDTYTGTTVEKHRYDYEAVERGAAGELSLMLVIRQYHEEEAERLGTSMTDLAKYLTDMLAGGIRLGSLTTKGFGLLSFADVQALTYDFTKADDVAAWLLQKQPSSGPYKGTARPADQGLRIEGTFALRTSLLVRNTDVSDADRQNHVHAVMKQSRHDYVIPGTTVKGVLRHQAAYILRRLGKSPDLLRQLMGFSDEKGSESTQQKSRFYTEEVYFRQGVKEKKQTRNAVDRFTGATIESKLFAEKPVWQEVPDTPVFTLAFSIDRCQDWEAGLALFLLRDLWTGRIALGADKAIGRGYLKGTSARIVYNGKEAVLDEKGAVLSDDIGLEALAQALVQYDGMQEVAQ